MGKKVLNNNNFEMWLQSEVDRILSKKTNEVYSENEKMTLGLSGFTGYFKQLSLGIEKEIESFKQETTRRFEDVDKKFEKIDKRFEQVDKRFDRVEKSIEELRKDFGSRLSTMSWATISLGVSTLMGVGGLYFKLFFS